MPRCARRLERRGKLREGLLDGLEEPCALGEGRQIQANSNVRFLLGQMFGLNLASCQRGFLTTALMLNKSPSLFLICVCLNFQNKLLKKFLLEQNTKIRMKKMSNPYS